MDAFFKELGDTVRERWKRENFSLPKFPRIACAALEARSPAKHVDLAALMRDFLLKDDQPLQTQSGFGQPEIVAYEHPKFYIQLLFWLDGTTDIHQHEFSGAFHVMHGSSIHARYTFENGRSVTPHLRVGDVRMRRIELLETGRTVPIVSGGSCIHSLFHLDTPSVTVVVRTQNDPGTGPQFNYLPPHLAVDPDFSDTLTMRRKQLLAVLEATGDDSYAGIVRQMVWELDFERGFYVLQSAMGHLQDLGEWEATLRVFRKRHGALARGVDATLDEAVRRDSIKGLRATITEPGHRFFLALLMNAPTRADVLALVRRRFPGEDPVSAVLRWAEELATVSEDGFAILDAAFPETIGADIEEQPALFLGALRYFMTRGRQTPRALRSLSADDMKELVAALAGSCLRVLVK